MFIAIVPAYNEEKRIGSVVRSLFKHVDKVVVVDDCSSDKTKITAKEAGALVLSHSINRGQGASLETGQSYARQIGADYILHFDGDGQLDVNDINPALEKLKKEKADILFGSRFLNKNSNIPVAKKYFIHPLAKIFDRFFTGLRLTDAHNGFRILNNKALNKIQITQDRMAHASEIPRLTKKHNLNYTEFSVHVTYYEFGQNIGGGVNILKDIFTSLFIRS
jgi:polyprenyl-phospho-N-acetylgalactosaminyl synthase